MYKRIIYFFSIILILSISGISKAELIAHWDFDESSGTTAKDSVGGYDGILLNGPSWISGVFGGALSFDGDDDCVQIGNYPELTSPNGSFSVALWVNIEDWSIQWDLCPIGVRGDGAGWALRRFGNWWSMQYPDTYTMPFEVLSFTTRGVGHSDDGVEDSPSWTVPPQNEWLHITCIYDNENNKKYIYFNGVLDAEWDTNPGTVTPTSQKLYIGAVSNAGDTGPELFFDGLIDDVQFFNHALSESEVENVMQGSSFTKGIASKPHPANGASAVLIDVGGLSWKSGEYVEAQNGTHNVFFGTDVNSVTNATINNTLGATLYQDLAHDNNSIELTTLEYATTYYWRVDEVNNPAVSTGTVKGRVWEFTTESEGFDLDFGNIIDVIGYTPVIVSDEQEPNMTCNGSGLDENDLHSTELNTMWLGYSEDPEDPVWIQYEFDKIYKFFELLVWNYNEAFPGQDYGARDVNVTYSIDGENWEALDDLVEFQAATGEEGYAANTVVDMNYAVAKYIKLTFLTSWTEYVYTGGISEVRFSAIPTRASNPDPEDGANNIEIDHLLNWKSGRGAAIHKVYVGTDADSVKDGVTDIMEETEGANLKTPLDLATTYYWKVDEVNDSEDYTTWDGPVWSFSTVDSIIVEDFEVGYDTTDANAVWMTWSDGYYDEDNGAEIGKDLSAPGLSEDSHSGDYSAPIFYDNTGSVTYSEVTANSIDLPIATNDWSIGSPEALVLWFLGDVNNTGSEQLYVKLNDTRISYDGPASKINTSTWTRWEVSLEDIDLGDITSISVGLERIGGTDSTGTLYMDDIRLTIASPEPSDPGTDNVIAYYKMENDVKDSSGNGIDGTFAGQGNATYVAGPFTAYGQSLDFNPDTEDVVDLGSSDPFNFAGSFSISFWVNIQGWGNEWGHSMIATRGEGMGFSIRRGGGWIGGMQDQPATGLSFTTRGISIAGEANSEDMIVGTPVQDTWTHIACVYDANNHIKSVYYDGVLVRKVNTDLNAELTEATVNASIGARALGDNSGFENYFDGMLDEIKVFDDALTYGEVKFMANPAQ